METSSLTTSVIVVECAHCSYFCAIMVRENMTPSDEQGIFYFFAYYVSSLGEQNAYRKRDNVLL